MKKRKPGEIEYRVLTYLFGRPNVYNNAPTAGEIGGAVWRGKKRGRGSATQGGGDYAAQMLLGRMRKQGWVRVAHGDGSSQWELTTAGHDIVRETFKASFKRGGAR